MGRSTSSAKTFETDKLWRSDPLLLCRFQNDILNGVFSTDPESAVKYFGVGETVWMCSQTSTHSLIKPPSAHAVQSDLLSVMFGRNERMTTICTPSLTPPPFFFFWLADAHLYLYPPSLTRHRQTPPRKLSVERNTASQGKILRR